jgi:hypothetical protein
MLNFSEFSYKFFNKVNFFGKQIIFFNFKKNKYQKLNKINKYSQNNQQNKILLKILQKKIVKILFNKPFRSIHSNIFSIAEELNKF